MERAETNGCAHDPRFTVDQEFPFGRGIERISPRIGLGLLNRWASTHFVDPLRVVTREGRSVLNTNLNEVLSSPTPSPSAIDCDVVVVECEEGRESGIGVGTDACPGFLKQKFALKALLAELSSACVQEVNEPWRQELSLHSMRSLDDTPVCVPSRHRVIEVQVNPRVSHGAEVSPAVTLHVMILTRWRSVPTYRRRLSADTSESIRSFVAVNRASRSDPTTRAATAPNSS